MNRLRHVAPLCGVLLALVLSACPTVPMPPTGSCTTDGGACDPEDTTIIDDGVTPEDTTAVDDGGTPEETATIDDADTPEDTTAIDDVDTPEDTAIIDDGGAAEDDGGTGDDACKDTETCAPDAVVEDTLPPVPELCNGIDDNDDGEVDEGFDKAILWPDTDKDGYGDVDMPSVLICADAEGYADNGDDCDDDDGAIHPEADDLPDDDFIDNNCDGIDGDANGLVFVSEGASGIGTLTNPLADIQAGLVACAGIDGCYGVAISQGDYIGKITLIDGISIYGGYASDWQERGDAFPVTVTVTASDATGIIGLDAQGIATETTVERLTITVSGAATQPGTSAYGVRAIASPALRLRHLEVTAGAAAAGSPGSDGAVGANGGHGTNGRTATCDKNYFNWDTDYYSSGQGWHGTNPSCPTADGGYGGGGDNVCCGFWGATSPGGACGGAPGTWKSGPGSHGCNGWAGADGADGQGGNGSGAVTAEGTWSGTAATDGAVGAHGVGGGGGGGGGGTDSWAPGGGAGGGAGGCGGQPGKAAGAGGGSFGLFVIGSTGLQVEQCTIDGGDGGTGGEGGQGGNGGSGGLGGTGGLGTPEAGCSTSTWHGHITGTGGNAGNGAVGVRGGHGGGGSGGVSYGIYCHDGPITLIDSTAEAGEAGEGGTGPMIYVPDLGVSYPGGNSGTDGQGGDIVGCD